MGKLILSSGKRTDKPYVIASAGVRIYSIEELCYYLYHHVYMIDDDLLNMDLFDWMETELNLQERASKLKLLKLQKTGIKTLVTVIMCSSDYFTEIEIKKMLKLVDSIIGMSATKRSVMKANTCLKNQKYQEAATEFERLLHSMDAQELTPEEYGDIYHNLGVAKVHNNGVRDAAKLFYQAYEYNHREESLLQYLYCLKLSSHNNSYEEAAEKNQVSDELTKGIEEFLKRKEEEAWTSGAMKELENLKNKKAMGKMSEYYNKTDEMIDLWKSKLRQL